MIDYIKREDALNALKIARGYCPCAYGEIKRLPVADVAEVRHGKWRGWHGDKMVGVDEYRHYHYNTCSECGKGNAVKSNYCPNCGAKMDKEER